MIRRPAHDQAPNAATVQEWGAGIGLPGDAEAGAMRAAAQEVLSAPSYRANARRMSAALTGVDGAANAADEVEALLMLQARHQASPPTDQRDGDQRQKIA
jgi:UDP:flavonoid glycosyltransferase YjiC (YdhE family)